MQDRIIFSSPALIDYRTLTTLGVSVKETSEAIGKFGTGFKYSLAWMLANNHKVVVTNRYEGNVIDSVEFSVKNVSIRNVDFPVIFATTNYGDVYQLSFTTEIGKKMTPEEVLREMIANTLDEAGKYYFVEANETVNLTETTIEIFCPPDSTLFASKTFSKYVFWGDLPGEIIYADDTYQVKLYKTEFYYFRGVFLASKERLVSELAINIVASNLITDNRSITKANRYEILRALVKKSPEIFLPIVALANSNDGDYEIYFDRNFLTQEFYNIIEKIIPKINLIPKDKRNRLQKQLLSLWDHYVITVAMKNSNYEKVAKEIIEKLSNVFKITDRPNIQIIYTSQESQYVESTNTLNISLHARDINIVLFSAEVVEGYMLYLTFRRNIEQLYATNYSSQKIAALYIAQLLGIETNWKGEGAIETKINEPLYSIKPPDNTFNSDDIIF